MPSRRSPPPHVLHGRHATAVNWPSSPHTEGRGLYAAAHVYAHASPVLPAHGICALVGEMCGTEARAFDAHAFLPTQQPPDHTPLPLQVCVPSAPNRAGLRRRWAGVRII